MVKYKELTKEQRIRRGRKLMKKLILEELAKRKKSNKGSDHNNEAK
ncbi:MAG: hypothetical protein R6V23_13550 [Bacteroidales bacterium]